MSARMVGAMVVGLALLVPPALAQEDKAGLLCDELAASPYDAAVPAGAGVPFDEIDTAAAIPACEAAVASNAGDTRRRFQLGRALDAAEHTDAAIAAYQVAADQGYAMAFNAMGVLYEGGYGVEADAVKAAQFYQQAADAGIVVAMENLGLLYEHGTGVAQDYARAAELYGKAAATGSAYGSGALGWLTENGYGVARDQAEALRLYQVAAEGGVDFAQNNLGVMYAHGTGGLPQDDALAYKYYSLSAEQGWPPAYLGMAWSYRYGKGVEGNLAVAEDYLRRAMADGDEKIQGDARNDLAWMFATENTRLDEAEILARAAVDAGPEIATRLDTLAWVLHLTGRNDEALPLAEKAAALDTTDPVLGEHLVAIKAALGK